MDAASRCVYEHPTHRLYVGNLPLTVTNAKLRAAFLSAGFEGCTDSRVVKDRMTGRSLGYGFVVFTTVAEATAAKDALHEASFDGRVVRVNFAAGGPSARFAAVCSFGSACARADCAFLHDAVRRSIDEAEDDYAAPSFDAASDFDREGVDWLWGDAPPASAPQPSPSPPPSPPLCSFGINCERADCLCVVVRESLARGVSLVVVFVFPPPPPPPLFPGGTATSTHMGASLARRPRPGSASSAVHAASTSASSTTRRPRSRPPKNRIARRVRGRRRIRH